MAKTPTTVSPQCHVIKFNFPWGSQVLISSSLLTQFAQLMSMCSVVEGIDLRCADGVLAIVDDVDYGITTLGERQLATSRKEGHDYAAFHDATFELDGSHPTIEEFRFKPKEVTE